MGKYRIVLAAVLLGLGGLVSAPVAQAEPQCLFEGDWNCEGPPQWNGPGLNTSDVPGTYGGWTTLPLQCDPITYSCQQVAP